jgi:hypothetical protein
MKMRQVFLKRGNLRTTTWVPATFKLKRGTALIGGDGREWKVLVAYKTQLDNDEFPHGWKVGGLA